MSQFFFQLRRKIYFFGVKNIFSKIFSAKIFFKDFPENREKKCPKKIKIFKKIKFMFFFDDQQKYFFEVEKKVGTQFRCRKLRAFDL